VLCLLHWPALFLGLFAKKSHQSNQLTRTHPSPNIPAPPSTYTGTVADLWHAHNRGEPTSFNPLGMVEALLGAMSHSAELYSKGADKTKLDNFVATLRLAMHNTFRYGQGTRDLAGPSGLTTEQFIDKVAWRLGRYVAKDEEKVAPPDNVEPSLKFKAGYAVDKAALKTLFEKYDKDKSGTITVDELELMLAQLGVAPLQDPSKKVTASEGQRADSATKG